MTRLACLDGPAAAALSDQLVAVYRAAMGAPPFAETEVERLVRDELADEVTEAGYRCWLAYDDDGGWPGSPTGSRPRDPARRLVRQPAPGGRAGRAERWMTGHSRWSGSPSTRRRRRGIGRALLERLLAGAGAERAWLVTHDLDTPARALYRSLGFQQLGRGPLGWHDADRVVLGAALPPG